MSGCGGDTGRSGLLLQVRQETPRGLEQESNITWSVIYLDHSGCCAGTEQKRGKKRSSETGEETLQSSLRGRTVAGPTWWRWRWQERIRLQISSEGGSIKVADRQDMGWTDRRL